MNLSLKYVSLFFVALFFFFNSITNKDDHDHENNGILHVKVYYQEGRFAGWPANNGIWKWSDEILVGFVEGEFQASAGFHTYNRETARNKYARSRDGGQTWTIEDGYERGQTGRAYDHNLTEEEAEAPKDLEEPIIDFTDPGFVITFMRDDYHDGPSTFYYSMNRGKQWRGPYNFPNLGTPGVATRTDYIVEGPQVLHAFMNVAKENGREGRVIHTKTVDGGLNWELVSWLGDEPEGFEIMPSTVKFGESELFTVIRARDLNPDRDYLQAYRSVDGGETWVEENEPVYDTGHYGAPPSLVKMNDGRLALAYAYRSEYGSRLCLRFSSDNGKTWGQEIPVRSGDGANGDVGYPQIVQREDGKLVIVYYWNHALNDDPTRYIAASIVEPELFE
ncbi:sialidase family protein [Rhodohalobacter sulfatireducens]|uniref:Glycoside hydrolase n=1 Tax=Rhodohalobacter sulfatireducens TaxID=2911366 RepID=A0ABS9KEM8_9BACT|nr:sialidase family protein [Rhodohalobacter sulfatireducens]MCG2589281.1 glycoside hydrolase [Rhodohalobacter sulfatireducens]